MIDKFKSVNQKSGVKNRTRRSMEMRGPYRFISRVIDKEVKDLPGNFVLGRRGDKGNFVTCFVGRGGNLKQSLMHFLKPQTEMPPYLKSSKLWRKSLRKLWRKPWCPEHYKEFKFSYTSSLKEAYENACKDYHKFGESELLDNSEHPRSLEKRYQKCPMCPIFDHLVTSKKKANLQKKVVKTKKRGRIIHFRTPGIYKVEIEEVTFPSPGPGEVLVRVKATCVCGSTYRPWGGGGEIHPDEQYPERAEGNPSHMVAGEIEEIGKGVKGLKVGDKVTLYYLLRVNGKSRTICGGYADYIVVAQELCLLLPRQIDFIEGALLTDLYGTMWTRVKEANVQGAKVCIWGCGPVGLATLQEVKALGAKWVACLEPLPFRREMAKKIGADLVIDPSSVNVVSTLRKLTKGGADACIVTSAPFPRSAQQAMDSLAVGGRYSSASIYPKKMYRGRFIYGESYFQPSDFPEIVELALKGKLKPKLLVTHIFTLDKIGEAYHTRFMRQNKSLAVIVIP